MAKRWQFRNICHQKRQLNPAVIKMVIDAPAVAQKARPGQFIILRVDENGEYRPLTIADYDGAVIIISQLGKAETTLLAQKQTNEKRQVCGKEEFAFHN